MEKLHKDFIGLLSAAINSQDFPAEALDYDAIIALAQKHSVANMLYHALVFVPQSAQPEQQHKQLLKELAYAASIRDVIQVQEWTELKQRFAEEKVCALPLKGCVIREAYPKQGIRYMSDTDILIDPKQAEKVKQILQSLHYQNIYFGRGTTDIYVSPMGMNYEVHRSVYTAEYIKKSTTFLKQMLNIAKEASDDPYSLSLPNEEHYAYILCHFVKHLVNGGVGVRQVMDVYICRKYWKFDEKRLEKMLSDLGLSDFAATLERLANCWFGGGEEDALTKELGEYIMGSGTFGNEEQFVVDSMLKQKNGKNRFAYMLSRAFPPFKTMCFYYPVLKKCPIFLPLFWIWRILNAVFFGRAKLSAEIETIEKTDADQLRRRSEFYRRCGLDVYRM